MLGLKKITKIYKTEGFTQKALNEVTLYFRENEFASILGPSGSGKTTLLNIIGGLDHYDFGDLVINETSTKKYNDRDWDTYRNHRVGFVFQNYNLISHQSVLANVELALTLSGVSKKERNTRAKKALTRVGLKDHMYKKPSQLSGGQMQRVAIARALVNDPEILLADEPTGALDTVTSKQVMDLLKEIAAEKLVIMVTHNPDLAEEYSTRIIRLQDGKILDDSNPYAGEENTKLEEEDRKKKSKKTSMNFTTALNLSLNNLMTKKGRTFLTAFAGSIGIIGIALILSLSHGINLFITKTEEDTLSSYPLMIEKDSVDMSSMIQTLSGNHKVEEIEENKIQSINIMGDMFETMSQKAKHNDMKSFKKFIENHKTINKYTSSIGYSYQVTLNLYKAEKDKIIRVNPTTVLDTIGMGTSGMSSLYSGMLSNYDVFYELIDNQELLKKQFDLIGGSWPSNANEMVLNVGKNNEISDYTLYSLGILSQEDLKEQFNNMTDGKEVSFKKHVYDMSEFIGLTFKLVPNTSYYVQEKGIWINKSEDEEYMKNIISSAEEVKIVGIIRQNEEAVSNGKDYGLVGYKPELMKHLIEEIQNTEIAKKQLEDKEKNVFTGREFTTNSNFDMSSLTPEQMQAFRNMSQEEMASFVRSYSENMTSSYEENLRKLGIAELDNPDTISLYPKDFDAKEEIVKIIDEYNKKLKDQEKIEYTDVVGIMMSSVTTIVNVISSVLIAFVAISLIVSSIMIAIITYISVIERTKEIGILRAIGASKKDISRVFNAETLIEGLAAGVLGILVTLLLNIPINVIIKKLVNISHISVLPVKGALILILISVLLTVTAGFIPAKIASKKDPVEALRSE